MINRVIDIYGNNAVETLDKIKQLGFKYSTRSGITWGMDDLTVPKEKPALIAEAEKKIAEIEKYYEKGLLSKDEKSNQVIEVWKKVKTEIEKLVPKAISSDSPVFIDCRFRFERIMVPAGPDGGHEGIWLPIRREGSSN